MHLCMIHMIVMCNKDNMKQFYENNDLTNLTPSDPRLIFDTITFKEGLQLINMNELYVYIM